MTVKLTIPDLGDFKDVEVIEVLVAPGDTVAVEDPLITLETDKATMDVPAEQAGEVVSVDVSVGDRVSQGDAVVSIEPSAGDVPVEKIEEIQKTAAPEIVAATPSTGDATHKAELVVIGAGPGGYTAAFRAADLGMDVVLIERWPTLGGVCLNVGCIPSKALLHAAKVIDEAEAMAEHGVVFGKPRIDALKLRDWKNEVVGKLTGGLSTMAKQRKVRVIEARAQFESANRLRLDNDESVDFEKCIIAAGSEPVMLPNLPVSVVELMDSLMPGTDKDLLRPFLKVVKDRYDAIMTSTKVTGMRATVPGIEVAFEGDKAPSVGVYDRVLISVGRRANGDKLGAEKAGVQVDERGIVSVDKQMRTNVPHIFAIGDLAGGPMLAHKATHEAKVAAEVAHGDKSFFDARTIPSVAYTDPEIAWVGLTETEAKEQGVEYEKAQFPWAASGRALSIGRSEGFTKLLFDPKTDRVLGGAIVGPSAGDLIAEIGLAIEMGADATDISLTIHPHPTLSETVAFTAEAFEGTLTDLYIPKKRKR